MADKTLLELLDEEQLTPTPVDTAEPAKPEDTVEDQVEDQLEETAEDTDEVEAESDEPEVQPESKSLDLRELLEAQGYDTSDLSNDDIGRIVMDKIKAKAPVVPPDPIRPEKAEDSTEPEAGDTKQQAESKAYARKIAKLSAQPELKEYVTFNEAGVAVPKDQFGEAGVEAAKKLNQYLEARRLRAKDLIDDPVGFLEEDLQGIIESAVERRIQALRQEQEEAAVKTQQELAQMTEQERVQSLLGQYSKEIYKIGANGRPQTALDSDEPILSEFGRLMQEEYEDLAKIVPETTPASVLLERAYKTAKRLSEVKPPAPTPQEKKKKFLERRNQESPSPSSPAIASPRDVANGGGKMSLLEALLQDEANADNPELAALRG